MPSPEIVQEYRRLKESWFDLQNSLDNHDAWKRYVDTHPEDRHGYGFVPPEYPEQRISEPTVEQPTESPAPRVTPTPPSKASMTKSLGDVHEERMLRRMGLGLDPNIYQ